MTRVMNSIEFNNFLFNYMIRKIDERKIKNHLKLDYLFEITMNL
jgi:hypothetical protein